MGGSNSFSTKKDFNGEIIIKGKKYHCILFQAGGTLTILGDCEKITEKNTKEALLTAKLDIVFEDWGLKQRTPNSLFYTKK